LEEELTPSDLAEYLAYFKVKAEEEDKARKKLEKKPVGRQPAKGRRMRR
jgi:hypothetical protein